MEEIIENVRYQIPAEYYDKLLGGIIITGGGSNMKNIERAFITHTHIEKVRVAKFVNVTINSNNEQIKARNGMLNTVLGLLAKGNMNCAGKPIDPHGNLFEEPDENDKPQDRKPRQAYEKETGTIRTAQEEEEAEAERQRKKEEEERLLREAEEAAAEAERQRKKENSWFNKFKKGLTKFGKDIVSEE